MAISARRVAREVALLILFALDISEDRDVNEILEIFWAHFGYFGDI